MAEKAGSISVFESGAPANVESTAVHNGFEAKPDHPATSTAFLAATARKEVYLDDRNAGTSPLRSGAMPGFTEITNPDYFTEPYMRVFSEETYNGNGLSDPRMLVTGRVANIDIAATAKGTKLGGAPELAVRMALLDGQTMPGELGMIADVIEKEKRGLYSQFTPLLVGPRDTFFVWKLDPKAERFDGKPGELKLYTIISGCEPLLEDTFSDRKLPDEKSDLTYGIEWKSIVEGGTFLMGRAHDDAEWAGDLAKLFSGEDTELSKRTLAAIVHTVLKPNYDARTDKHLMTDGKLLPALMTRLNGHREMVRDFTDDMKKFLYPEPNQRFMLHLHRALRQLHELESYRETVKLNGTGKKTLAAAERHVLHSVATMFAYVEERATDRQHYDASKSYRGAIQDDRPHGGASRFEIIATNDQDRDFIAAAREVEHDPDSPAAQIIATAMREVPILKPRQRFVINALDGNGLAYLHNLDPRDPKVSVGTGLVDAGPYPHDAFTHYRHEMVRSLFQPFTNDERFPGIGTVLPVEVAFMSLQPDRGMDTADAPVFAITSAKHMPWSATRKILELYHHHKRDPKWLKEMVGKIGLSHLLTEDHVQDWRLANFSKDDVKSVSAPLRNGTAVATITGPDGKSKVIAGKVPGQKQMHRGPLDKRPRHTSSRLPLPVYGRSQEDVEAARRAGRASEIAFAGGAVHMSDGPDKRVRIKVAPQLPIVPPKRRGRHGRR